MRFELVNPKIDDTKAYWEIYKGAFPIEEQKPIPVLKEAFLQDKIDMWLIKNPPTDELVGMMIVAKSKKVYLLNYLAIIPSWQGYGIGTRAMEWMREYYDDTPIILEIEDTQAEDIDEREAGKRIRRKNFYRRLHYRTLPFKSEIAGVVFEILSNDIYQTPENYLNIFAEAYGESEADLISII